MLYWQLMLEPTITHNFGFRNN